MSSVDTKWFHDALADRRMSMRELARRMDLDIAIVSRMLSGQRGIKISEVSLLARAMGVSEAEILPRLGLQASRARHSVPVKKTLTKQGFVVDRPGDEEVVLDAVPDGCGAIRAETHGGDCPIVDGWAFIYQEGSGINPMSLGRLSLLTLRDGGQILATPLRMEGASVLTCLDMGGETRRLEVTDTCPVLRIVP